MFPSTIVDWVTALQSLCINYQFLLDKFHKEQKLQDVSMDPVMNNPLSQAAGATLRLCTVQTMTMIVVRPFGSDD